MAQMLDESQQEIKEELHQIKNILNRRNQTEEQQTILSLIDDNIDFTDFRNYADPNPKL